MFPFVLRLMLGNSPKSQGPNAAFSLQETVPENGQRHQAHREEFVGPRPGCQKGVFIVLSMRSWLQVMPTRTPPVRDVGAWEQYWP